MAFFDATRLPRPSDPAAVAVGLERWREAVAAGDSDLAAWAGALAADGAAGRPLLEAVFGNSPYLTELVLKEAAFLRHLLDAGPEAAIAAVRETLWRDQAAQEDTTALMRGLRLAKRRIALAIALADIAGAWGLEQVTAALSDTAEIALRLAARHLLRRAAAGGAIESPDPADPEKGSGLIILAMGKLGARELNYSSDIDLIVLYDDGVVRTSRPDEMMKTFVRIARDLVRIMEERTADGYVFRTDLRLRPDPGATPLAVSVSAAEAYYSSLGQNWERAAMIKARPVAGDDAAGAGFLDIIRHFVWRRNLDFAAIQDIHSIKRQIGAHKGHRQHAVNGHNVKIGRGGIREIEFFAQTQQLIYGGRDMALRAPATVAALDALVDAGQVDRRTADDLCEAYRFLRRLEHRIQMVEDRQTHELPADDAAVARLATFLGYADAGAFRDDLLARLATVSDHYGHLFEEAPSLSGPGSLVFTGAEDDPETLETLRGLGYQSPSMVAAQIRAWHHGRYRATRSTRARELLTELIPAMLAAFGRTPAPDQAFLKFDEFLARLPAGVQLFSLFYSNPALLDLVAEIMGTAPRLADLLARRPQELDAVLTQDFFGPLPDAAALAADMTRAMRDARDFEDELTLSRRWTNEQRLRAGAHILRNITGADRTGPFLSDVADLGLQRLQAAAEEDFARRYGRFPGAGFAILGLGRLGGRSLSLRSDLDLITIYEVAGDGIESDGPKPLSANEFHIKLTQRLINAITAQTGEGQLYDVDLRLRPSGSKGPLAVSLEAFAKYHRESAWTWEHMALTRARVITGPAPLAARIRAEIDTILCLPRDPDRLLFDVADMRNRIARDKGDRGLWDVKSVRGGMTDIQFIVQYLLLRHAHDQPHVLAANTTEALRRLMAAGVLPAAVAGELIDAMLLYRRVQGFLRLATEDDFDIATAPDALRAALARSASGPGVPPIDFATAERDIRAATERVKARYDEIVGGPAALLSLRNPDLRHPDLRHPDPRHPAPHRPAPHRPEQETP